MNKICTAVVLIVSGNLWAGSQAHIDLSQLSDSRVDLVEIMDTTRPGKTFMAATLMNSAVKPLCTQLQNYSSYPSFMPNMAKTQVVEAKDGYSLVDLTLKLPMGKIKRYRLKMQAKTTLQSCQLSWQLVPRPELSIEETIADTSGSWSLTEDPAQPNKTRVQYQVYTDPGPVPLGFGWLVDSLSKDSIPDTLNALRTKVASDTR